MEYRLYLIDLYDIYGSLLTDKQKTYFELYYFDNLSLAEISEEKKISRNAIHKHIMDACEKIENYESMLKVYEKTKKIMKFSNKLDDKLKKELEELIKGD